MEIDINNRITIYALFKDGCLYQASYGQNSPFYMSLIGAKAALRSITNINDSNIPRKLINATKNKKREYLEELKTHFEIRKISLNIENFKNI